MRRSLEDLIGKKGILKDHEGRNHDVLFPKNGVYSILGIKFPVYDMDPKFIRMDRGSLKSRIEKYYGCQVDIIKNKVYKRKNE